MFEDCCVECGHLLSRQRNFCPFCGWSLQSDQYLNKLGPDYQIGHLYTENFDTEQLSDPEDFQRVRI